MARSVLALPVLPGQLPNAEAAAGWGGDRLVSLDGPDGAWAVIWQTDWDTKATSRSSLEAARQAMQGPCRVPMPSRSADVAGGLSSPVLVLVADSDETLRALEGVLGSSGLAPLGRRRVKRGAADDEETDTCVGNGHDGLAGALALRVAVP